MNTTLRDRIAALLRKTGRAHHSAFEASDGADTDWPIWYADYAQETFVTQHNVILSRSQLVYCLMNANFEHEARAPEADWADFYADEIVDRFAPSAQASKDRLALYHFDGCPFCALVRAEIDRLDIDVELRDVLQEPRSWDVLLTMVYLSGAS